MGKATSVKHGKRAVRVEDERPLIRARREMDRLRRDGEAWNGIAKADMTTGERLAHLRWRLDMAAAEKQLRELEDRERAKYLRGTVQTHDKIDAVAHGQRQGALARMYERGQLTEDQWRAYAEINVVIEMIKRGVDVKSISVEARVDCGKGDRDVLIEGLARVRLEATYTAWRARLPVRKPPRAAIIALIETPQPVAALSRTYRVDHRLLTRATVEALDRWDDIKGATWRNVDAEDVEGIYRKIGCGQLRAPMPKGK
jgi:hypothetical protein